VNAIVWYGLTAFGSSFASLLATTTLQPYLLVRGAPRTTLGMGRRVGIACPHPSGLLEMRIRPRAPPHDRRVGCQFLPPRPSESSSLLCCVVRKGAERENRTWNLRTKRLQQIDFVATEKIVRTRRPRKARAAERSVSFYCPFDPLPL
jgi:hypothetical protein